MSQTDISTTAKYYDYVNFTVDCIIEELEEEDVQDVQYLIHESIDSADIMIHYGHSMNILQNSRNEPKQWEHMVNENEGWRQVINTMAYTVFRQDMYKKLEERGIDAYK